MLWQTITVHACTALLLHSSLTCSRLQRKCGMLKKPVEAYFAYAWSTCNISQAASSDIPLAQAQASTKSFLIMPADSLQNDELNQT